MPMVSLQTLHSFPSSAWECRLRSSAPIRLQLRGGCLHDLVQELNRSGASEAAFPSGALVITQIFFVTVRYSLRPGGAAELSPGWSEAEPWGFVLAIEKPRRGDGNPAIWSASQRFPSPASRVCRDTIFLFPGFRSYLAARWAKVRCPSGAKGHWNCMNPQYHGLRQDNC
jgi:hypothetical protein